MPYDASALLAIDRLYNDLHQELDFAAIMDNQPNVASIKRDLSAAKADITEAFALVSILNSSNTSSIGQKTIVDRISELSKRAHNALISASQCLKGDSTDSELFAAIYARIQEFDQQASSLAVNLDRLKTGPTKSVDRFQSLLTDVGSLLDQARMDVIMGEIAQRADDLAGAVLRKQRSEQALNRVETFLGEAAKMLKRSIDGGSLTSSAKVVTSEIPSEKKHWKIRREIDTYLSLSGYSKKSLVELLTDMDGFKKREAAWVIDNSDIDWNEQAVKSAAEYRNLMAFSQDDLIEQLIHDGFTFEQAQFGAINAPVREPKKGFWRKRGS